MAHEHLAHLRFDLGGFAFELFARAALCLAGVGRQLHPVDGEHLAADESLGIAQDQYLGEDVGNLILEFPDDGRHGGEVRGLIPAQGDEGDVLATGALNRAAADNAPGVGKQDQLEQGGRRVSRCASGVIAEALVQTGQIEFVIEQVMQCVFEGAGKQLFGKHNGKKLGTRVDSLVAGHLVMGSCAI